MDVPQLEEIIRLSQSNDTRKAEASNYLNQLRGLEDRWTIGLKLFFESSNEIARYFGLSLVRDFLIAHRSLISAAASGAPSSSAGKAAKDIASVQHLVTIRAHIRGLMMKWTNEVVSHQQTIPQYILNNVVAIITQLLKTDYPEVWPTAFDELLTLGAQNMIGLDITVRAFGELEFEVVVYDDRRTKEEISHNTLIKDTMRQGTTMARIVNFLCSSIPSVVSVLTTSAAASASAPASGQPRGLFASQQATTSSGSSDANVKAVRDLAVRCVRCLSEMVGWIDISLVVNEMTMSTIYRCLQATELEGLHLRLAACSCLYELVKKGMDPFVKLKVIASINLIPILISALPLLCGRENELDDEEGDDEDDDVDDKTSFGTLIDCLFEELLGCWVTFEDNLSKSNFVVAVDGVPLSVGTEISLFLSQSWQLLMAVFSSSDSTIALSVQPSLARFLALLKQQQGNEARTQAGRQAISGYFLAIDYVRPLLMAIYQQMQFEDDFEFDASDEIDAQEIEAKKEVRRMFVNCCRVLPDACLELIGHVLRQLPQPLSSAPWPMLEAALKLVFSFSECGPKYNKLVAEGSFPEMVAALHRTDVALHAHPQVVLAYYELSVRYSRQTELSQLQMVVGNLTGTRGIRHSDPQLRCRSAYLLFKLAEAMEGRSSLLLAHVGPFGDLLFHSDMSGTDGLLSESAEIHLLEAMGLMTSSAHECEGVRAAQQDMVLREIANSITTQISSTMQHPHLLRYADQFGERIAHRISCLSSLSKGHSYKSQIPRPEAAVCFESSTDVVLAAVLAMPHCAPIRSKTIILFHRLLVTVGPSILGKLGGVYAALIETCDMSDIEAVVQLLVAVILEFESGAAAIVEHYFTVVFERCVAMLKLFEEQHVDDGTTSPQSSGAAVSGSPSLVRRTERSGSGNFEGSSSSSGAPELPQVETERIALQKVLLVFIQQAIAHGCHAIFLSERNLPLLERVLAVILVAMQGGSGRISLQGGMPLRKQSIIILTLLTSSWGRPSPSVPAALCDSFYGLLCSQALPAAGELISVAITNQQSSFQKAMLGHPGTGTTPGAAWGSISPGAEGAIAGATGSGGTGAGSTVLSFSDAATLTMLTEIGPLFYAAIHNTQSPAATAQYFTTVLFPAFRWPTAAIEQLVQFLMTENLAPSIIRENFKKFLRSTIQWQ